MISYVKPSRLHVCVWLLLSYLVLAPLTARAISPVDASRLPFRINKDGNQYIYTSVDGKNFTKNTLFTSAGVQHNAPILTAEGPMPYPNKSGAKVTLNKAIDKAKAAAAAASGLSAAAAAKLKPGSPYVVLAEVSCVLLCPFAIDALYDWGVNQLKDNGDGTFGVPVPDPGAIQSDGKEYQSGGDAWFPSMTTACQASASFRSNSTRSFQFERVDGNTCKLGSYTPSGTYSGTTTFSISARASSCAAGKYVVNGACVSQAPMASEPLGKYMQSNYMGNGWNHHLANMTAAIISNGGNVFTDGTSGDITGPVVVPLVSTETKTSVNLSPGTTTEVAPGHVGPSDTGTKTTTTTTTAKNSYTSGSSSTGGPTVSATQQTQTTTNVTNNVTNITNTTTTTETKTDDAPKEEEKDFCEKNPDSLACAEADTPDGEIPETQIELSYEYESLFGNGSCPTVDAVPFFGQNVQVVDMPKICQQTTDYIQPFVLVSAALIAMAIFAGGVRS